MAIRFLNDETTLITDRNQLLDKMIAAFPKNDLWKTIKSSKDVSGIELRMRPPFIKENGTERVFPFPGYSRLYCLTIVISDVNNQLVGNIDLQGFPKIGDNENLPINKAIFYWQTEDSQPTETPSQIHVFCSVLKSKQRLRNTGEILKNIKGDKEYKTVLEKLGSTISKGTGVGVVTNLIADIAGIVGGYLGEVEDKPIGTIINSYTTLYGDFDNPGIQSLTYTTPKVDFSFKLVVRNKIAEENFLKDGSAANLALGILDDDAELEMTKL